MQSGVNNNKINKLTMGAFSKVVILFRKYPLLRGMASYSVIWPLSSLIQQTVEGKNIGMCQGAIQLTVTV